MDEKIFEFENKYELCSFLGFIAGIVVTSLVSRLIFTVFKYELVKSFEVDDFSLFWKVKGNYTERSAKLLLQCDPSTLLIRNQYFYLIMRHFSGQKDVTDRYYDTQSKLRRMKDKILLSSALNPSTNHIMPRSFRMSGYLFFNGPVCIALSLSRTLPEYIFWSWLNQTQAAVINYYNLTDKGKSKSKQVFVSYSIAVFAALLSSIGIVTFIKSNLTLSPNEEKLLLKILPLPTNSLAAVLNCYFMSRHLLISGIKINCNSVSFYSKIAAKKSVFQTMFIRALLPIPCFLIPTLIMSQTKGVLDITSDFYRFFEVFVSSVCFGIGLPIFLAIIPEYGMIKCKNVEKYIRTEVKNDQISFFYHRGL